MKLEELNTVETSVETWVEFCNFSMNTDFYKKVYEKTGNAQKAAAFTLFHNYISTFSDKEREKLESDPDFFYKYAEGFINELAPYRYNSKGYNKEIRSAFFGKIRRLLARQKDKDGNLTNEKKYVFIKNIVRFCSSLDFIIKIRDEYKEFLHKQMPEYRAKL